MAREYDAYTRRGATIAAILDGEEVA